MPKIWITGDMHGFINDATSAIAQCKNATDRDYLIVCGDFGAEYDGRIMGSFKKEFKNFPGKIIVLRGNHDDRYWEKHVEYRETYMEYLEEPLPGWDFIQKESWTPHFLYQKKYPNILYTRDEGDIIRIGEYNFLFLPGAYSIDKDYRLTKGYPYNPKEQLNHFEMNNLINKLEYFLLNDNIDFVISHTFPLSWEPAYTWLFLDSIDQSKVDKNTEKFLDEIEKILYNDYIHWFGGHFHYDMVINEKATMLFNKVVEIGEYCRER